jgi:uncharacterized protein
MNDGCDGNNIPTWGGGSFDLANPEESVINIWHISKSLGNECRFTGQCDFYSVAEHCVHCCEVAQRESPGNWELAFAALMHDAAEAYTGDVSKPLKKMIAPLFAPIEKRIEDAVKKQFYVSSEYDHEVKIIDMGLLKAEKRHLSLNSPLAENLDGYPDYEVDFKMWDHDAATKNFMAMYRTVTLRRSK